MEAVVLAGGLGTRLRAEVPGVPKPLAPVWGRPFLEYVLRYWIAQKVGRFILSVGYLHELIESHFCDQFDGAAIDYAVEPRPLGTGGGLLLALRRTRANGPVLVQNGDTYFEVNIAELLTAHRQARAAMTMALRPCHDAGRYDGVLLEENGQVRSLVPSGGGSRCALVNGGVYLVERDAFRDVAAPGEGEVSLERDLLPALLGARVNVQGLPCGGRFIDIGVPADYRRAPSFFRAGVGDK